MYLQYINNSPVIVDDIWEECRIDGYSASRSNRYRTSTSLIFTDKSDVEDPSYFLLSIKTYDGSSIYRPNCHYSTNAISAFQC